jgi:hypothetical protein
LATVRAATTVGEVLRLPGREEEVRQTVIEAWTVENEAHHVRQGGVGSGIGSKTRNFLLGLEDLN